jgi:hypothetical protein
MTDAHSSFFTAIVFINRVGKKRGELKGWGSGRGSQPSLIPPSVPSWKEEGWRGGGGGGEVSGSKCPPKRIQHLIIIRAILYGIR